MVLIEKLAPQLVVNNSRNRYRRKHLDRHQPGHSQPPESSSSTSASSPASFSTHSTFCWMCITREPTVTQVGEDFFYLQLHHSSSLRRSLREEPSFEPSKIPPNKRKLLIYVSKKNSANNDRVSSFCIWAQENSCQRYRRHTMLFNTNIILAYINQRHQIEPWILDSSPAAPFSSWSRPRKANVGLLEHKQWRALYKRFLYTHFNIANTLIIH